MLKFLIILFLVVFVFPSMIFSLWSYLAQKKESKNRKAKSRKPTLTHAQMMALLEPDGIPAHREKAVEAESAPKTVLQTAPHEVQTIVLKREIYY